MSSLAEERTMSTTVSQAGRDILRDLARQYIEIASLPIQQERRDLWTAHNSLKPTRVPILATFGMWNVWCRELWNEKALKCMDPILRSCELELRMKLFQHEVGDDSIVEPWLRVKAVSEREYGNYWGVKEENIPSGVEGGAWMFRPPVNEWSDMAKLSPPPHRFREKETAEKFQRIQETIGDIVPVALDRSPAAMGFRGDISTNLARLRGLEQIMIDMYECPDDLKKMLAFMRDGVISNIRAGEAAGDITLLSHQNQCHTYGGGLEGSRPDSGPRKLKQIWGYFAAQEFTLISPAMHEEFMLNYQLPIMNQYGLTAYGCCEDLTKKIDMLRKVPNLRIIAVAPLADVAKCAEQIRGDYVFSWRPNPTDMVCCGYDEGRVRKIIREGLTAAKGCHVHIHLKDVETLEGDYDRLKRWVRVVRDTAASV